MPSEADSVRNGATKCQPMLSVCDEQGQPLAGGSILICDADTTRMAISWKDPSCEWANCNPVILDSRGSASVYLKPGYYHLTIRTVDGRVVPGGGAVVVPNQPKAAPHAQPVPD